MFDIVLFQPEIPPNTGNVIRLCANAGARLHLIEPLGFSIDDSKMRRAGLDYHEWARMEIHKDWATFQQQQQPARLFAVTTKGTVLHHQAQFRRGDFLVFGPETRGLPIDIIESVPPAQRLRVPMQPGSRSLNLSNTVAILVYEAWRQMAFSGGI